MPLGPAPLSDDTAPTKAARSSWARFIKKVFAADPLVCPDCGGTGKAYQRLNARMVTCAFCDGTGHVTQRMVDERERDLERAEGRAQAAYYDERREYEDDRAVWAQDNRQRTLA